MEYTEDFLKKMVSVGTLGYALDKIINVLDINDASFTADFDNPESPVAKAYQKGLDKSDYAIDMKLFELAKNGDMEALKKYEQRKILNLFDAKKQRNLR